MYKSYLLTMPSMQISQIRVIQILRSITPRTEAYSVDEAFLDLSGLTLEEAQKLMDEIKDTIARWVGLPLSMGQSKTKTLAKVANHYAKKGGKNLILWDTPWISLLRSRGNP